jgi:endo-1,4-beta-xylanase
MTPVSDNGLTRRMVLKGAAGAVAAGALSGTVAGTALGARKAPLWKVAHRNGVVYGAAIATWMFGDAKYMEIVRRQAALIFTQDDFLWYTLKPSRDAPLNFDAGDQIVAHAERNKQLLFGAHLVWDEGFGEGWAEGEMFELTEQEARELLFGTVEATMKRYKGRVAGWIVVNEAISDEGNKGMRTDVPWYQTIGRSYVAESFRLARSLDPDATLVLNEFGFETVNQFGDRPGPRRRAALQVIDELLKADVPVDAFGIQGHLLADRFKERFNRKAYRRFLAEIADRGLDILITEVDVLDDGLPRNRRVRDRGVADCYERYIDTVLREPAVKSVMTFGLSDRYTWLQEDYPREDGAHRRALPYNSRMHRSPAYNALHRSLRTARNREQLWQLRR